MSRAIDRKIGDDYKQALAISKHTGKTIIHNPENFNIADDCGSDINSKISRRGLGENINASLLFFKFTKMIGN